MERMLAVIADDPFAAVAGLVGMVCLAAWPLFRRRSTMLMTYIGNNLAFVAHYALLHQWTAVAMNGLMGVQTVVAIWLVRLPRLRWAYYALMPAVGGASLVTWHGLPSILAAAATMLSTIGRMQSNEVVLRILLLASTPCWTAHDLAVGSLPGLVADLLSHGHWRNDVVPWIDVHRYGGDGRETISLRLRDWLVNARAANDAAPAGSELDKGGYYSSQTDRSLREGTPFLFG